MASQSLQAWEDRRQEEYEALYEDEPVIEESYWKRRDRIRTERKNRRKNGIGG